MRGKSWKMSTWKSDKIENVMRESRETDYEERGGDPEVWVRFPALPDFLRSSGSETGSTQPRE
jgi:hypothetical protein